MSGRGLIAAFMAAALGARLDRSLGLDPSAPWTPIPLGRKPTGCAAARRAARKRRNVAKRSGRR